jgi:hypothetical protein
VQEEAVISDDEDVYDTDLSLSEVVADSYAQGHAEGMAEGLVLGAMGEHEWMRAACESCGWERVAREAMRKMGITSIAAVELLPSGHREKVFGLARVYFGERA